RLAEGRAVALVTDAGTPGISDPGFLLVRDARAAGVPVVPAPGGGGLTAAPLKRLPALKALETTIVLYESPHRILATLEAIGTVFGEREIVVARELTKHFEELIRATPTAHRDRLTATGGG